MNTQYTMPGAETQVERWIEVHRGVIGEAISAETQIGRDYALGEEQLAREYVKELRQTMNRGAIRLVWRVATPQPVALPIAA
jgi:hypothetical protein